MSEFNVNVDPEFPYMVPSMRCQPLVDHVSISFTEQTPINLFEDPDYKFGILRINMRGEVPVLTKKQHFFFTIDCSGSMYDLCSDGKTKMEQVLFTIENILRIFATQYEGQMSIQIDAFDNVIYEKIPATIVTKDNLLELIKTLKTIYPQGLTNIEKALKNASSKIKRVKPGMDITHIFLTDGDITCGEDDPDKMKLPTGCKNIFIGYGQGHNASLMNKLATRGSDDEYRFIDALEKASLVYGELLHNLLFKSYKNVTLKSSGCEIYDYTNNQWTTEFYISDLVSEQKRIIHLRSLRVNEESNVDIFGIKLHKTQQFEVLPTEPQYITSARVVPSLGSVNLDTFALRQKSQELLFQTRNQKSQDSAELKDKLQELFDTIQKYITDNNRQDDKLLKTICDDLYIGIQTFGTEEGYMFTLARNISQGRQQTYTCNNIGTTDLMAGYSLSDNIDSAFTSPGIMDMMREVSQDNSIDFDYNYDAMTPGRIVSDETMEEVD
jgi:von Willebrand factor type A domain